MDFIQEYGFIYKYQKWSSEEEAVPAEPTSLPFLYEELFDELPKSEETTSTKTIITFSSSDQEIVESLKSESEKSLTHPCLKEASVSDNEMKFFDLQSIYPVPKDPGLDRAFWLLYPPTPVFTPDGADKFFYLIDAIKAMPIACLRKQLPSNEVSLRYYNIDVEAVEPLCEALRQNVTVATLDLKDNILTPKACSHINTLLCFNTAIKTLNLSGCKIGPEGALQLEDGISISASLRHLDLSNCGLGTDGLAHLTKSVSANTLLRSLDLSNNDFDETSGPELNKLLMQNDSLDNLNLSWNDFHTKEASEKLFGGLMKNLSINNLNLSWNSMGKLNASHLSNFISHSKFIKCLDLTANRFTDNEVPLLAKAIANSKSLEVIRLNQNPIGPTGVTDILMAIDTNEISRTALLEIDLGSYWAKKDAIAILENLRAIKPDLTIKLGGILENFKIAGPNLQELFFRTANHDAMNCKRKKERKNFGHFVLSLKDTKISKEKFKDLVKDAKIKISESLVNEIMNLFLVTKKSLSQAALKEAYLHYFPDTKLPPPPKPKIEEAEEASSSKRNLKSKRNSADKKKDKKTKK